MSETAAPPTATAGAPRRRWRDPLSSRSLALWFGVLGPPLLWGAHLALGDLIYELGCSSGMQRTAIFSLSLRVWGLIQTGVVFAAIVLCGLGARGAWRRVRRIEDGTTVSRAQAFALAGMASAAVYGLIVLYAIVPQILFFHSPCGTSL
jgi:hypothetical protein